MKEEVRNMSIFSKFLEIQKSVDVILKDGENKNDKYDYVSGSKVLSIIRPMMNDKCLLLIPRIVNTNIIEGQTRSGTARFVVELSMEMLWIDTESGEHITVPFYANGADLGSAERAVGKALTYCEKYHLLKMFHIPTDKDDPDNDEHTSSGEKKQAGTAETVHPAFKVLPERKAAQGQGSADCMGLCTGELRIQRREKRRAAVRCQKQILGIRQNVWF